MFQLEAFKPLLYVAVAMGLFVGGIYVGYQWEAGVHAKALLASAKQAAETARRDAETEFAASLSVAKAGEKRRVAAIGRQHTLEQELIKDEAARTCRVSDGTLRVLNDSIDAANGAAPQAGSEHGAAAAVPEAGGADSGEPGTGVKGRLGLLQRLSGAHVGSDRVGE